MSRMVKWASAATAAVALVSVVGCGNGSAANNSGNQTTGSGSAGKAVTLNETGSSLMYPLFTKEWIDAYKTVDPSVTITAASTGSGTGISQSIAGTVQIGASDAYLADGQMQQSPGMLNIPMAISAQQIMYNLPELGKDKHLQLSGDVLAKIYMGKITKWNDPAIAALNPGVSLPNKAIVPVHRQDGSGDTFLFTQFMTDTNKDWANTLKYSTTISWPSVQGAVGANGNDGVVSQLANTPYSIGYVGISWLDQATQQGLGYAALQNKAGKFVLPEQANIQAAASANVDKVPDDERISLVYADGDTSYPIVNFEYAIVNSKQTGATASALKNFLKWAIDPNGGNSSQYMNPVHFLPLPASVEPKSEAQIAKIGG